MTKKRTKPENTPYVFFHFFATIVFSHIFSQLVGRPTRHSNIFSQLVLNKWLNLVKIFEMT